MTYSSLTFAILVLLEAIRSRFFSIIIFLCLGGHGLAWFLGQITLTETLETQSSLVSAFYRLSAVYMISLFVITSMVREFHDYTTHLWLSLPLPRSQYLLMKFFGFVMVAALISILYGFNLCFYTSTTASASWALALFCELLIMLSVSLLCVLSFTNTVYAFTLSVAFYLLARSITAIHLMTESILFQQTGGGVGIITTLLNFITYLLPDLSQFTLTATVVYHHIDPSQLIYILVQTIIYCALLLSICVIDFSRKPL